MNFFVLFGAEYLIFFLALPLLYFSLKKERKFVVRTIIILGVAVGLSTLIKSFYYVPRPFVAKNFTPIINQPSDGSFPSTHTAVAFALAIAFFVQEKRRGWILLLGALLVGLTRVLAGVHYWQDIVGSFVLALTVNVAAVVLEHGSRFNEARKRQA